MYRVLITDDEPISRLLLKTFVEKNEDFVVCYEAQNADEAVSICKKNPVDIVFMDIMLPGKSGIKAIEDIYSMNKSVTIFIVSAYKSFAIAESALKCNATEFIVKPVPEATIQYLLEKYKLEHSKMNSELLFLLLERMKHSDFIECCNIMKDLSNEIIHTISNPDDIKNHLLNIGNIIYDAVVMSDLYKEAFLRSLREEISENRKLYDSTLFYMIDYCFKIQNIIHFPILENIFDYIEENIESEISLKKIVDDCAISQGYLSRIFKKGFNTTVMTYIHLKKINIAKRLIFNESFSVSDTAFKLSYNEGNYFSKVFKKYEGITVEQYRNTII